MIKIISTILILLQIIGSLSCFGGINFSSYPQPAETADISVKQIMGMTGRMVLLQTDILKRINELADSITNTVSKSKNQNAPKKTEKPFRDIDFSFSASYLKYELAKIKNIFSNHVYVHLAFIDKMLAGSSSRTLILPNGFYDQIFKKMFYLLPRGSIDSILLNIYTNSLIGIMPMRVFHFMEVLNV